MEWNMDIVKAEFVVSNATVEKCPKPPAGNLKK